MRRWLPVVAAVGKLAGAVLHRRGASAKLANTPPAASKPTAIMSPVGKAFANRQSDVVLEDQGRVIKLLPDDNVGSRHQRFLVDVDGTDTTILIAHNIDLAERVPLRRNNRIRFKGEYEWTDKGGTLHWTHHDPKQWHEDGWIEHNGNRYG